MPCHWVSPPRATASDNASQADRAAPPKLPGRGGTLFSLLTNPATARDVENCRNAIDKPMDMMALLRGPKQ
eukprot:8221771-Prorocentrum_lima.AAC.1